MKTNNNIHRMDLSNMPIDIISVIGKHLLSYDNKFRFNKIFRKKQDNKLLKFFFGEDVKLFKFINNYIGNYYKIECKDIDLNPLLQYINDTYNLNIKKIRLLYHPIYNIWITLENFKFYDENDKRIRLNVDNDDSDKEEMDEKHKQIFDKIQEMKIENSITKFHNDFYSYKMEKIRTHLLYDSDNDSEPEFPEPDFEEPDDTDRDTSNDDAHHGLYYDTDTYIGY